jgi:hypothetical protein
MTELRETVTYRGQELYAPVLACRPVRFEDYSPERQRLHERVTAQTGAQLNIYPGSVYQSCEDCGIEVAVGPRQQQAIEAAHQVGLLAHVCCMIDADQRAGEADEVTLISLDNPFERGQ